MSGKWLSYGLVVVALLGVCFILIGPELGWFGDVDDDGALSGGVTDAEGLGVENADGLGDVDRRPTLEGVGRLLIGEGDVIGRVLDIETRQARANVQVIIRGQSHDGRQVEATAETGADGRFHLARVAAGRGYRVSLVSEGATTKRSSAVEVRARDVIDLRTLWIGAQGGLRGVVFGPGDQPLANARVELHPGGTMNAETMFRDMTRLIASLDQDPEPIGQTESAGDGTFAFSAIEPGVVTLIVRAEGHSLGVKQVAVTPDGGARPVHVHLEEAEAVMGRVVTADRVPVRGARVALIDQADQETGFYTREFVETESDGRFTIASPPSAPQLMAIVSAEDYPLAMAEVKAGRATNEIVLHGGAELEVRLLEQETDRPIADAQVVAILSKSKAMNGRDGSIVTGMTDAEGLVTLPARVGHLVTLWFQHADIGMNMFVPQAAALGAMAGGFMQGPKDLVIKKGRNEAVFRVPAGRTISGTVKDEEGNPLAGATVSAAGMGGMSGGGAVSDADGAFELQGVPRLPMVVVQAKLPGYVMQRDPTKMMGMMAGAGDGTYEVVMTRAARVSGRVLRADGSPVARARVRLVQKGGMGGMGRLTGMGGGEETITDSRGQYSLESAETGKSYNLVARAEGFLDGASGVVKPEADGVTSVEPITLIKGHTLTIDVADPDGRALAGARVEVNVAQAEDAPTFSLFDRFRTRFRGVTNAAGDITLRDLPLGEATIVVRHGDHAGVRSTHALEATPTKGPVSVRLSRAIQVEGRVVDGDGKAIPDAFVQPVVNGEDTVSPRGMPTGRRGQFKLTGIPAGASLLLQVSAEGWKSARMRPAGNLMEIEVVLEPIGEDTLARIKELEVQSRELTQALLGATDNEERQQINMELQRTNAELGRLRSESMTPGDG